MMHNFNKRLNSAKMHQTFINTRGAFNMDAAIKDLNNRYGGEFARIKGPNSFAAATGQVHHA